LISEVIIAASKKFLTFQRQGAKSAKKALHLIKTAKEKKI